ncbi:putative lipase [Chrysochromulina parva virophage Larry]|nr:putative lipase [Chrysochromulina parva virophage Larry]
MVAAGSLAERAENLTGGSNASTNLPLESDIPYALISDAAYTNYFEGTDAAQQFLDAYQSGYDIIEDFTAPEYITAVNEEAQKVVIGFRGTDSTLMNLYDDIADVEIAAGLPETSLPSYIPSRFKTGEDVFKQVQKAYPGYDMTLTGHSLGGSVARYVGDRNAVKAVVFNSGQTPLQPVVDTVVGTRPSSTKYYLTDTLDLISNTSRLTEKNVNIVTTKPKQRKAWLGSHDIENYIPNKPQLNPVNVPTVTKPTVTKPTVTKPSKINVVQYNKMKEVKMTPKNEYIQVDYTPFKVSYCDLYPEKCYPKKN